LAEPIAGWNTMTESGKSPRKLTEVMARDTTLSQLLRTARELKVLQALMDARMGAGFAANCKVAALRADGTLVLVARSPVWASRLRYLGTDLVEWAKQVPELARVSSVHVQVGKDPV